MVYLREPVRGKEVQDGGDLSASGLRYGLSAMQGWRRNMEDAHLAVPDLDENISLFGVFDGHGGRGVSRFVAQKLPGILRESEEYKKGDYARALEKAFLHVDEKLREADSREQIDSLDQPDAGAAIHPIVVPRKVLQRFLGTNGGPAAEETQPQREGGAERCLAAQEGEPEEDLAVHQDQEDSTEKETQRAEEGRRPEASTAGGAEADKENAPAAPQRPGEPEEELTPTPQEEPADASASDAEDEEMALVDPSKLTRDPTPEAQGCVAVVTLLVRGEGGPKLYCANAGDSRAIMSRQGLVVPLSEDHKPENASEMARIVKAGGFVQHMPGGARVQGDLNLSRAIGDLRYKKPEDMPPEEQILTAFPEVRCFQLTEEDEFMVLGCDGIWERSGNQEMVDFVRPRIGLAEKDGKAASLSAICGQICDKGLCPSMDAAQNENFDGTGCDNMTVMVVQMKGISGEPRKRPAEEQAEGDGGKENKKQKPDGVEKEST